MTHRRKPSRWQMFWWKRRTQRTPRAFKRFDNFMRGRSIHM